jgi:hypothetical protein
MGITRGPKIIRNGLVLALDAADKNSYSGSGTNWKDLSGNLNPCVLGGIGGPTFNGSNGGSFIFDGIDDFANGGISFYLNIIDISVSVWVKPDNASKYILSRYSTSNGFYIFYEQPYNRFRVLFREVSSDVAGVSAALFSSPVDKWYNVTWTKSSRYHLFYINGSLVDSIEFGTGSVPFSNNFLIFGRSDESGPTIYSRCNLSTVLIYNRQITANEVLNNFQTTKSRFGL